MEWSGIVYLGRGYFGCVDFATHHLFSFCMLTGEPLWSCATETQFLKISCLLSLLVRVNIIYLLVKWVHVTHDIISSMTTQTTLNALSTCIVHAKYLHSFTIVSLSLVFILVSSRLYFCEPFEMLYSSQGPKLSIGQAQMESVHAELCRKTCAELVRLLITM